MLRTGQLSDDEETVLEAEDRRRRAIEPGMVFGKWTVIGENPHKRRGKVLCRCECGAEREVYVENLINGRSKSCKCRMVKPGFSINELVVKGYPYIQPDQHRRLVVRCKCTRCKRIVYPAVRDLFAGRYRTCGCFKESGDYMLRCEKAKTAGDPVHDAALALPPEARWAEKVLTPSRKKPLNRS